MMKLLKFTICSIIFFSLSSFASAKSQKTTVRCEQNGTADQWIEVAVVLNIDELGHQLLVVEHNYDDESKTLIKTQRVSQTYCTGRQPCYLSSFDNVKLTTENKFETANFSSLKDGPSGLMLYNMNCFTDGSIISFD